MPVYNPQSATNITMKGNAGGSNNDTIRILSLLVTPTVAMGYSLDISSYGFTSITNVQAIAERNTSVPMEVLNVGIKSVNTNAIVFNLTQGNNATVALLGINVLSGSPVVAANTLNNITLHVRVEGV